MTIGREIKLLTLNHSTGKTIRHRMLKFVAMILRMWKGGPVKKDSLSLKPNLAEVALGRRFSRKTYNVKTISISVV